MKSKDIMLGLLLFVAGSMTSCDPTDMKRCVNKDDMVVEDEKCLGAPDTSSGYTGPGAYPHHWYYGGNGMMGQKVYGGYTHPASGVTYHSASSKGGFGHSAGIHGGSGGHSSGAIG